MNDEKIEEQTEKSLRIVDKVKLICKRVILGLIIIVLLITILVDTSFVAFTIKARDYIETTGTLVGKEDGKDIYAYEDINGQKREIVTSIFKDKTPKDKIKIKYDKNNPNNFYEEGLTMEKEGIIWYIVKIIILILLVLLFFNKKLLSKIKPSTSKN